MNRNFHHHREFWKKAQLKPLFVYDVRAPEKHHHTAENVESKEEFHRYNDALEHKIGILGDNDPRFQHLEGAVGAYPGRFLRVKYLGEAERHIDLQALLRDIDGLLKRSNSAVSKKNKQNLRQLDSIIKGVVDDQKNDFSREGLKVSDITDHETLMAYGSYLEQIDQSRFEDGSTMESYRQNTIYQSIENNYDVEAPSFSILQYDAEGNFDDHKARENKALFLSLMQQETENFTRFDETVTDHQTYIREHLNRFARAMQVADQGLPGQANAMLKPGVKNILVGHYFESLKTQNRIDLEEKSVWTLVQLSQSPHFNKQGEKRHTSSIERATIALAMAGGRVAKQLNDNQEKISRINEVIADPNKVDRVNFLNHENQKEDHSSFSTFLQSKRQEIEAEMIHHREFLATVQEVIHAPQDAEGDPHEALVKWDQNGHPNGFVTEGELSLVSQKFETLETNDSLFYKQEQGRSTVEIMGNMGIDLRLTYDFYRDELLKNPQIEIKNWEKMSPAQLSVLMENIIPPNVGLPDSKDGRKMLIVTLRSMSGNESDPERMSHYQKAMRQVAEIKNFILKRQALELERRNPVPEMDKRMKETMGVNDAMRAGWELLKGQLMSPSWIDKFSGAVGIYAMYRVIKAAWEGKGWSGKIARGGLLAVVANNLVEAATGRDYSKDLVRGMKEAVSPGIEERAKNEYEEVLVQKGTEELDEEREGQDPIGETEHIRALYSMRNAPYHKLVKFYEASDRLKPNYSEATEKQLFNQLGIDASNVVSGKMDDDARGKRTRFVVKEAFRNSIETYAELNHMSTDDSYLAQKEIWIHSVEQRNYTPHKAKTSFPQAYAMFHNRQNEVTFQRVQSAEISSFLIETTMNNNGYAMRTPDTEGSWSDSALMKYYGGVNAVREITHGMNPAQAAIKNRITQASPSEFTPLYNHIDEGIDVDPENKA